jgi:formate dehydrogenase gamma subunit
MFKVILIFLLLFFSFISAQSVEECMECHSDNELTKFIDDTVEISLYVNLDQYSNSIHGDMECTDCHSDIEDIDHGEDLENVDCAACHDEVQEVYLESIHAGSYKGNIYKDNTFHTAYCKDCHGTHDILPSDDEKSKTYPLNITETCGNCHLRPEVISILGLRGEGPVIAYHNSIHDRILHEDPDRGAPSCVSCHGAHDIYVMSDPRSTFSKFNRAEMCGKCHTAEEEEYKKSIHWRAVQRGHMESPTCNDCHGEHHILSPQDKESSTNRLNSASQVCANCHSSPTLMRRFGLDPERFTTYSKTYHGLAVLKGSPDAANCTSCHEVHAIMEEDHPESSVNKANLINTCGKCHEDVTSAFINIPVHPSNLESRNPIGFYAENIYIWLIVVTIGGMIIHNIIIFVFYLRKKKKMLAQERTYQRFQPFEVYQHFLLLLSFFLLVITGFALKFPDALWVQGLTAIGLDETLRGLLHRIFAVLLVVISIIQTIYFIASRKGRKEIAALMPKVNDVTGFVANMKYYLGMSTQKPRFGRWDYTEKAEYLALIWGTAVMAITGFVLWFPEFFMSILPSWVFETSEIIHYYEAWLATLAIIVWHWFFVIYHPEKYPMSLTWMNGKVTEEEMKHHHPLEYDELNRSGDPRFEHPDGITTSRDHN